jgi:hypothetical protein
MMSPEDRAAADARNRARLAELPPPTPAGVARIADLFTSIRLRIARDRARSTTSSHLAERSSQPDTPADLATNRAVSLPGLGSDEQGGTLRGTDRK